MKAILHLTTGNTVTLTGTSVEQLRGYFGLPSGLQSGLGWVSTPLTAVNMNHVVFVEFKEAV